MAYFFSSDNNFRNIKPPSKPKLQTVCDVNYTSQTLNKNYNMPLIVGNIYSLKGYNCDGFEMQEKEYEVIALINSLYGVTIKGVVVKQVSGNTNSMKFTLTKLDCENLNIPFQNGLEIFSQDIEWSIPTRIIKAEQERIEKEKKEKQRILDSFEKDFHEAKEIAKEIRLQNQLQKISQKNQKAITNHSTTDNQQHLYWQASLLADEVMKDLQTSIQSLKQTLNPILKPSFIDKVEDDVSDLKNIEHYLPF